MKSYSQPVRDWFEYVVCDIAMKITRRVIQAESNESPYSYSTNSDELPKQERWLPYGVGPNRDREAISVLGDENYVPRHAASTW